MHPGWGSTSGRDESIEEKLKSYFPGNVVVFTHSYSMSGYHNFSSFWYDKFCVWHIVVFGC